MRKRIKGKSDKGRVIITAQGEEPKSARGSKEYYQLWKLAETLTPDEIRMLIVIRKDKLKYEKDSDLISDLRTEILILSDACKIVSRKIKQKC